MSDRRIGVDDRLADAAPRGATSIPRAALRRSLAIIGACLLPRLVYAWLRPPDAGWGAHYWPLATSLLAHGVLGYEGAPSSYYEPLYPAFLALARRLAGDRLFGVLVLQALVGSSAALFLHALVRRLEGSARAAAIAVALYALDPYLVGQAAALEEVTLLTAALMAAVYCHATIDDRGHAIGCGVAFGAALLIRATVAPVVALAVLALRGRPARALVVAAVASTLYLPYAIRNHGLDGSIAPTRGGFSLFKANCKYSEQVIPLYTIDVLNHYAWQVAKDGMVDFDHATEREVDRFYTARAIDFIRADPARFAVRLARNALYLFYPRLVPFHPVGAQTKVSFTADDRVVVESAVRRGWLAELAYTGSYVPILLTAIAGMFLRRREIARDELLYAVVFGFVLVYSVTWPATRVRAPMEFVLIFYSACAIGRLLASGRVVDARA